ncbi:hypothetical protein MYBA111488_20065 [Mycobacterium basiliense]
MRLSSGLDTRRHIEPGVTGGEIEILLSTA